MPPIVLYGAKWHFSSDIVPLPAFLGAIYHGAWVLAMVIGASVSGRWPHGCDSGAGRQWLAVFALVLAANAACFILNIDLAIMGIRGDFEDPVLDSLF
jgi:hypothetical protein